MHSVRKDLFKENQIAARVTCENRSLEKLRKKLLPAKEFVQEAVKTSRGKNHSLRLFYDCVIRPIADLLEGDEIVIVPDGPLCLIPFAACVDETDKYLSESTRIRILPSLTSIKLITDCPEDFHSDSGALLLGDPWLEEVTNETGEPILSSLPCAREEVETIGHMLKIPPLTGKEATKEEVLRRIGSVALVHIAAHGNMENGEIALAPNPGREASKIPEEKDYILKMADVQGMKLCARLVVLSCCHSAQGKVTADGVVGIGRAFLAAGARSVLLSLWAIDDEATMEFMKCFYNHLARGCSASVALHRAMKCLRDSERFGAVKFWAPFVLIGDDVTIEFGENYSWYRVCCLSDKGVYLAKGRQISHSLTNMLKQQIEVYKKNLSLAKDLDDRAEEVRVYGKLGNYYRRQGDFEQAIECHNQQLSIARDLGHRDEEGRAYCNLGNAYQCLGDFKQAIEYHNQSLKIAKELGQKDGEGAAYGNLGIAYRSLGYLQQAIEYHNQALKIAKELGQRDEEGLAYGSLGNVYHSLGDFQQAIEYHNQRLKIANELGQRDGEGQAYGNLGIAYRSLGDFQQAIEYHNQALKIDKELGQRYGEARAYGNLANAYQSLGDFKQAIEYFSECLKIAKELGQRDGEGSAYCGLGNAYQSLGDFKKAIELHNQSLSIAKELGQRHREGSAYCGLGNAYQILGDFKQAIEYHDQSLKIARELGQRAGEGGAYCSLGNAYQRLGDFKKAIEHYNQSLSIAKELGQRHREGSAYCGLGNAYHKLGDFKQAIVYHKQHLKISRELEQKSGEGCAYGNLGNAYSKLDHFEEAIEHYNQSLSIAKELGQRDKEGLAYCELGVVYEGLGDFEQAMEYHNQHLNITKELGKRDGEGRAYGNLGNAYHSLGDFKRAIEYHNQLLSIAKELGEKVQEGYAFSCLGCDFELSGNLYEALDYYRSSVKLHNEVRALLQSEDVWKISYRNSCQHAYTALWRTLISVQKTDEALCVAEQGRAQALIDLIKLRYESDLLTPGSLGPELTISRILSETTTQTVFAALESSNIHFWVLSKGKKVHFRQKEVPGKDVVAFFESVKEELFKEHQITGRVACENRSLEELKKPLPPSKDVVQTTHKSLRLFYDCVIGPIADLLEGDELIIVPDGPLCSVPYAACVDEASRNLSETTRIRILPSITSLKLITDCPEDYHSKIGALLVGDPSVEKVKRVRGKRVRLPRLPQAEEEVKIIGEILNTKPLTGKDATKEEVLKRMGSVALVHIAAHGDMEAGEIALAPNPDQTSKIPKDKDFLLTMSDIQVVQLREKLVVLSCCHSAQGKVTAEGVVCIGRAFLGAGARSVLVSLWAIDDEATMEFMKSFYKHLCGGCSASVALNRAMKCLRESEKFGANLEKINKNIKLNNQAQ
ncbi:hypothetical protein ACROYT_G041067 [Oculina patagonica]